MANAPLRIAIVAALVVLGLVGVDLWVRPIPGLAAVEDQTIDMRFRLRGPRPAATDRVVVVGIDDDTRARFPELMQTRRGYAALVRALTNYRVKVIAFDLFFSAPEELLPRNVADQVRAADAERRTALPTDDETPLVRSLSAVIALVADALDGDRDLATAISDSKRVFLGAYFRPGSGQSVIEPKLLERARYGETADSNGGGDRRSMHATDVDFSLDAIAKGSVGAGAINDFRDPDGVRRRVPIAIELGAHQYMPLGLAVAMYDRKASTSYIVGDDHATADGEAIPLTKAASLWLDVLGRDQLPRISAAKILDGTAPASALADKLAFVGLTYSTYDKVSTSLDPLADGIELHATLAENILSHHLMRVGGRATAFVATLGMALIVILSQLRAIRRRTYLPALIALAAIVGYFAIAQLAFAHGEIIQLAAPAIATAILAITALVGTLATEGREKAHLRAVFSRYVSRTVVDRILADPDRAKLGGERKELTVLFSDIRGFSAFSETMRPEELASFLGEYLTPMTDLVLDSGGTLDKYIGDAVMALWAAPVDVADHAARACEVALQMQEALVGLNARWKREHKPAIAIGIGLNTGTMAVGNMGTSARFDYTVLGDQVNLGARLEALTKEYGVDILVGEGTMRAAGDGYVFREIDLVRVKGRHGAAPVYELVGRANKVTTDPRFADALAAYRKRDFTAARTQFAAISGDDAAQIMASRCAALETSPPNADWDGVYDQHGK